MTNKIELIIEKKHLNSFLSILADNSNSYPRFTCCIDLIQQVLKKDINIDTLNFCKTIKKDFLRNRYENFSTKKEIDIFFLIN